MNSDIVTTLRRNPLYIPTSRINSFGRPQMGFELTSFHLIAADEIERLSKKVLELERENARLMDIMRGAAPLIEESQREAN